MKISFSNHSMPSGGSIVVGVLAKGQLLATAKGIDRVMDGAIRRAIGASRFTGKKGQALTLMSPFGIAADRVVLIGVGESNKFDELGAQAFGGRAWKEVSESGDKKALIAIDNVSGSKLKPSEISASAAYGVLLSSYRFDKYRTREKDEAKPSIRMIKFASRNPAEAREMFSDKQSVADGVFFARDLISEPANVIYPIALARQARSLTKIGVKVEVLDEKQMAELGMGALLGVGQGSANKPRLVIMRWQGAPRARNKAPIAFVGKGVTFDTGGISIKPASGMEDMKWDMAGSGVVIGLMKALAGRKAKVNAVGILGLVENMPSSKAQRPGDVVKTMSGQTVEVLNTDAEGRLVLADAMWYCQNRYKPHTLIDLATLTGAIIVALGNENAGLFSNDDQLCARLSAAGAAVGENVWRMPLGAAYDKLINSDIADMKNIGGRWGGSITAAQFLQRFIKDGVKWAHLDIAGVTWSSKNTPTVPKGGTAFGVRLLDRLILECYEE
ncbi:MAG: leucyl aminopeptidase [Pseudomonadota bacterium]|nr:leucyl aminopeptidase [Pseudomonadota bacterium]